MNLWGTDRNVDFWTARGRGMVAQEELRAMGLLASISDERRFSEYAHYGMYLAMGNVSRRIYLVRRFQTVLELSDGAVVGAWCLETKDRREIPETDHVAALKNIIEGEELSFREIGNPSFVDRDAAALGSSGLLPMPCLTSFRATARRSEFDHLSAKRAMRDAVNRAYEEHAALMERARRPPWEPPAEIRKETPAVGVAGFAGSNSQTQFVGRSTGTITVANVISGAFFRTGEAR